MLSTLIIIPICQVGLQLFSIRNSYTLKHLVPLFLDPRTPDCVINHSKCRIYLLPKITQSQRTSLQKLCLTIVVVSGQMKYLSTTDCAHRLGKMASYLLVYPQLTNLCTCQLICQSGRDNEDFYRFLIVRDEKQAEKLLPFSFTLEPYYKDKVIRVDNYREALGKHGPGLGLKLAYKPRYIFWQELVIEGLSDDTRNSLAPSEAPPAYDCSLENGANDSDPPPYDFKNVPGKRSASKTDAKKI